MPRYEKIDHYSHGQPERTGVLLCNLGTPEAPTKQAVRRYLGEFLADPRVVELPRILWLPILHGIILNIRPKRTAHAYQQVWREDGSPLLKISEAQAKALKDRFAAKYADRIVVSLAMRYGEPSVARGLAQLREKNVRRILVLPLYPQYSASTTASVLDAVNAEIGSWRFIPELRFINAYYEDERYITALAQSLRDHWSTRGRADHLLMSFHGIPKEYFDAGDPYHCHCQATAARLASALNLAKDEWTLTFQSRFGPKEWLTPYTDKTLYALGEAGKKTVDVISPGFAADCLETLEEITIQGQEQFASAGGDELRYVAALNDRADHIDCLSALCERHLQGWPEIAADFDDAADEARRTAAQQRARTLGGS